MTEETEDLRLTELPEGSAVCDLTRTVMGAESPDGTNLFLVPIGLIPFPTDAITWKVGDELRISITIIPVKVLN